MSKPTKWRTYEYVIRIPLRSVSRGFTERYIRRRLDDTLFICGLFEYNPDDPFIADVGKPRVMRLSRVIAGRKGRRK